MFVSPELVISPEFRTQVLAKPSFYARLRAAFIDEAHCISLWGGSFRTDYAELGTLRGRLPVNIPLVVMSATLPEHILDDIHASLKLSENAHVVAITNARPNVALSVRGMKFSNASKADLRFLIPQDAVFAGDIPITLVYCNPRLVVEDVADILRQWLPPGVIGDHAKHDCVVFYHAKVGEARKRELEEKLRQGRVRILVCTDAVGMVSSRYKMGQGTYCLMLVLQGCDMRNIKRVVLWGLPPSFCALVQCAGRAARDMTALGEAILIIPAKLLKDGATVEEVAQALDAAEKDAEAENRDHDAEHPEEPAAPAEPNAGNAEVEVYDGNQRLIISEGAIRVEREDDEDDMDIEVEPQARKMKKKRSAGDCNSVEARYLTLYATTTGCRRKPWDSFFGNAKKRKSLSSLTYPDSLTLGTLSSLVRLTPLTSTYQQIPNIRCCDNCHSDCFPMEPMQLETESTLKRGRKKKLDPGLERHIREKLVEWRDARLLTHLYPSSVALVTGESLMGDDVVDQLATCGERITTSEQLAGRTRWFLAFETAHSCQAPLSDIGRELIKVLGQAYAEYDEGVADKDALWAELPELNLAKWNDSIPTSQFYGQTSASSSQTQKTHT